ncbi:MAG: peroxiredoxin family protein [Planctomycetes bacterium]|nr:peroxiredoxin family protein [Planctomycetota bacterium]
MKELRDSHKAFEEADTAVLGVSWDDVDTHKKFCDGLELPFDLIADPDRKVHQAYGFKERLRAFVLIDKKGVIRFVNRKYGLKKDQWDELLREVKGLATNPGS